MVLVVGSALQGAASPVAQSTARRLQVRRAHVVAQAAQVQSQAKADQHVAKSAERSKIYVGRGRFIEGNPAEYPDRTPLTGGFAGGEIGLQQFVADIKQQPGSSGKSAPKPAPPPKKRGLYIGNGKFRVDDGTNESRVMRDTTRDALVGGFSGGEVGLRSYVERGEVPFLPPGERRKQQSPLALAGLISGAAVVGGILVTDVSDLGERVLSGATAVSPAALAPLDENTKFLLEAAILLVGLVGSVVGGRALVGSLTSSIKESAAKLGTLAVFWLAVFVAAKIVLDG